MRKNNKYFLRKTHRWLGVIIGVQFLFWTVSGLYFSWTDIDEIHGDHFLKEAPAHTVSNLKGIAPMDSTLAIGSITLRFIASEPYYWVNHKSLYSVKTGEIKHSVTQVEAVAIVKEHLLNELEISSVDYLTEVGNHHEYRGRPLPAWAIHLDHPDDVTAYVSAVDGSFQRVRHNSWRWFDFLWMTHTMDYESRDNMNNWLLRIFSVFGLLTVLSGFTLFFASSNFRRKKKK